MAMFDYCNIKITSKICYKMMYCKTIFEKKKNPEKILNFEVHFRSRPKKMCCKPPKI